MNGAAKTTNGNGTTEMGPANSAPGQTVSLQTLEAIKQQPWYFGHITRADCDNILTDKGQDGDFMVRESETNVSDKHFLTLVSLKKLIFSKYKYHTPSLYIISRLVTILFPSKPPDEISTFEYT